MGKRGVLRTIEGGSFSFWCPGCERPHVVTNAWNFNMDYEEPTFSPSILVTGVQDVSDWEIARIMEGEKIEPKPLRCHSYVRGGYIEFLEDCTHVLKGRTIKLKEF